MSFQEQDIYCLIRYQSFERRAHYFTIRRVVLFFNCNIQYFLFSYIGWAIQDHHVPLVELWNCRRYTCTWHAYDILVKRTFMKQLFSVKSSYDNIALKIYVYHLLEGTLAFQLPKYYKQTLNAPLNYFHDLIHNLILNNSNYFYMNM